LSSKESEENRKSARERARRRESLFLLALGPFAIGIANNNNNNNLCNHPIFLSCLVLQLVDLKNRIKRNEFKWNFELPKNRRIHSGDRNFLRIHWKHLILFIFIYFFF
jgi:hypothetical protein